MDKCYSCGGKLTVIKDKPYYYDECGLDVILFGITQYVCNDCEETYASIPDMQKLHKVIGAYICKERKALLKPEEIKFLRKDLHLSSQSFAKVVGVTPETVSRWENGRKEIGEAHDRLIRSLYIMEASDEIKIPLCGDGIVNMFKELPATRKRIKQQESIVLNPQEWISCLGSFCTA